MRISANTVNELVTKIDEIFKNNVIVAARKFNAEIEIGEKESFKILSVLTLNKSLQVLHDGTIDTIYYVDFPFIEDVDLIKLNEK